VDMEASPFPSPEPVWIEYASSARITSGVSAWKEYWSGWSGWSGWPSLTWTYPPKPLPEDVREAALFLDRFLVYHIDEKCPGFSKEIREGIASLPNAFLDEEDVEAARQVLYRAKDCTSEFGLFPDAPACDRMEGEGDCSMMERMYNDAIDIVRRPGKK